MPSTKICAALFFALIGGAPRAGLAQGDIFPAQKGTRWTYEGEVSWQAPGGGIHIEKAQLQWQMEVVDSIERGPLKVALISGHPGDLAFYDENRKRGCYLLLVADNRYVYLRRCDPMLSREKLSLPDGGLEGLIHEEDLIFKLPLHQGEVFGPEQGRGQRDDTFYEWSVEEVRPAAPRGIAGVSFDKPQTEYVVICRTMPDHQIATYIPGVGLTHYVYSHHGTASDVDMKLVRFDSPGAQ